MSAVAAAVTRTIRLANGVDIPCVGAGCAYGCWTGGPGDYFGFTPEDASRGTTVALQAGIRMLDGALLYGTHRQISDVYGRMFAEGTLTRKDLFIATKVGHPVPGPGFIYDETPNTALDWSLGNDELCDALRQQVTRRIFELGVGFTDLILLHWPMAFGNTDEATGIIKRRIAWSVLQETYEAKRTRAIGVCNFSKRHLDALLRTCGTVPHINQVEVHPYCYDRELIEFCQSKGIVVEAYAPLASGAFGMLQDPVLTKIAGEVQRSVGQVILRWLNQKNIVVLPKSSSAARTKENISFFDFDLSPEQSSKIDALSPANPSELRRTCPNPDDIK
jgi:diketogulonate reductase-like aldo/keto reductase